MTYEVKYDVPLPETSGKGRNLKYPFDIMEVGGHFDVPDSKYVGLSRATSSYGKRHNKRFTVRKMDGFVRCWRVK